MVQGDLHKRDDQKEMVQKEPSAAAPQRKFKEAESCRFQPLPSVPQFRHGRLHLCKEVAGASGRPEEAFAWMCQVDKAQGTDELEDNGDFATLDANISAAFRRILHGELGRTIQVREEQAAAQPVAHLAVLVDAH